MQLCAYDEQNPNNIAYAYAVIFVTQNPSPPTPAALSYTRDISEYYPMGVGVLTVSAVDPDNVRLEFVYNLVFLFKIMIYLKTRKGVPLYGEKVQCNILTEKI